MRDNLESGWYFPTDPADPDVPWNPYYRDGEGNWIEAQTEGHVEVEFPGEIVWPLGRIGWTGEPIPDPETVAACGNRSPE